MQKQNDDLQRSLETVPDSEAEDDHELSTKPQKIANAFDMLGDVEKDEASEDEEVPSNLNTRGTAETGVQTQAHTATSPVKKKKRKKQKKAKESRIRNEENISKEQSRSNAERLDEIDLALQALSIESRHDESGEPTAKSGPTYAEPLWRLLAVENRHLNAMNEMRKLFGSVALEDTNGPTTPRRPQRGGVIHLDLASALTAQYSPVSRGQGLAGFALRRNVFMNGREEWPRATSGGLEMAPLSTRTRDGQTFYMFEHNNAYRDIQRQFDSCVASMDPQRMIQLLTYNPYHISTLLQVSEIAKQQGDHSVAGDLLERALFTFGRSVHSSFSPNLSKGLARLAFAEFENREFWLATWRYIDNLAQRGTFRTAHEWTKLLFSLDPISDPYSILLSIDSIALRGGQAEQFLSCLRALRETYLESSWPEDRPEQVSDNTVEDLVSVDFAKTICRPNLAISSVLARYKVGRERVSYVRLLSLCMKTWPFIFFRLFQDLNIEPVPKSIWGRTAASDRDRLSTETYVQYAKDLWSTPDCVSLLKEVASGIAKDGVDGSGRSDDPITMNEARHLLLSNKPVLMGLVPRKYSQLASSSSDPLPPADSARYWEEGEEDSSDEEGPADAAPRDIRNDSAATRASNLPETHAVREANDEQRELAGLQSWFSRFWTGGTASGNDENDTELERVAEESGVPEEVILSRQTRLVQLAQRVLGIGGLPSTSDNADARITDDAADDAASAVPGTFPTAQNDALGVNENNERLADFLANPPIGNDEQLAHPLEIPLHRETMAQDAETENHVAANGPPSSDTSELERTQRYLAGVGMLALKDFIAKHGHDEDRWKREGDHVFSEGSDLVQIYVAKARTLNERDRKFIIDYPLAQGAGQEARKLVMEALGRR